MPVHQKLGIILESGSKIEYTKNIFTRKWSPKLIFIKENFFLKKISSLLTSIIDFESMILALFDEP